MKFRNSTWDNEINTSWDAAIFDSVVNINEYQLLDLHNSIILDIGAHIGSFAYLSHKLGANQIYCFEAFTENFKILEENVKDLNGVKIYNYAVWRSDIDVSHVLFQESQNHSNSGGGGVMQEQGTPVQAIKFDEIVSKIGSIDLLKIDAEGSEFPILFTSNQLSRINEIIGEYHEFTTAPDFIKIEGHPEFTGFALVEYLRRNGFIALFQCVAANLGKFHAWRPGVNPLSKLLLE
jgi:FkbM family methyltransferase